MLHVALLGIGHVFHLHQTVSVLMDECRTLGVGHVIHLQLTHRSRSTAACVDGACRRVDLRLHLHQTVSVLMDECRTLGVGHVIHLQLTHRSRSTATGVDGACRRVDLRLHLHRPFPAWVIPVDLSAPSGVVLISALPRPSI